MTRSAKKSGKRQPLEMQHFIFEIKEWVPCYSLSVNHDKFRETAFREHVGIDLNAVCVFPQSLAGRSVELYVVGDRHCLKPAILQDDPGWRPRCVGALEWSPSRSNFYVGVPHESVPVITTALAHGLFRYVETYGPPLKRSKSLCSEFRFLQTVNLEEY